MSSSFTYSTLYNPPNHTGNGVLLWQGQKTTALKSVVQIWPVTFDVGPGLLMPHFLIFTESCWQTYWEHKYGTWKIADAQFLKAAALSLFCRCKRWGPGTNCPGLTLVGVWEWASSTVPASSATAHLPPLGFKACMFNNWISGEGVGGCRGALICNICWFLWCKYSHPSCFQTTKAMSLIRDLGRHGQ